ncbi:MAG: twin-arginine translocase TatA/TatE family subunit [Gammaproteobacteria bacterium HGW-Gammaproteobacteria-11]|nr:MAG: twin-arginine translocase TatA/TatE family subunit [Gammaproteobacteria bacterium HGW-Gammaproteobacteria-11]
MGIGGVSIGSLLIVLVIVMLLFGTKRLRSIGGDLGSALSGFKKAVKEGEDSREALNLEAEAVQVSSAGRDSERSTS